MARIRLPERSKTPDSVHIEVLKRPRQVGGRPFSSLGEEKAASLFCFYAKPGPNWLSLRACLPPSGVTVMLEVMVADVDSA